MSANIVMLGMGFLTQVGAVKAVEVDKYSADADRDGSPKLACTLHLNSSPNALLKVLDRLLGNLRITFTPYAHTYGEGDNEWVSRGAVLEARGTYGEANVDIHLLPRNSRQLEAALDIPTDGTADGQKHVITADQWIAAHKQLNAKPAAWDRARNFPVIGEDAEVTGGATTTQEPSTYSDPVVRAAIAEATA